MYIGVKELISELKKPFDRLGKATTKAKTNLKERGGSLRDKELLQEEIELILAEWDRKRDMGIKIHEQLCAKELKENSKSIFEGYKSSVFSVSEPILKVESKLENNTTYLEKKLISNKYKIVGFADKIDVYRSTINITDNKTTDRIYRSSSYKNDKGFQIKGASMSEPLSHLDDCVTGDTRLITETGIEYISEVIGKKIKIWNGKNWSEVIPYETGYKDIYRVNFSDGSYLDVSGNHKFIVQAKGKKFKELSTLDIIESYKTLKQRLRLPRANIKDFKGVNEPNAYDYGFIMGDGTVDGKVVKAQLYNKDKLLKFNSSRIVGNYNKESKIGNKIYKNNYTLVNFDVDADFCKKLKYGLHLPKEIFTWNKKSILSFIAGWADADGTKNANGVSIYGKEFKLRDMQLLLTKCNINSSCLLYSPKGFVTNMCDRKEDLYRVCISKTVDIPFQRIKSNHSVESKNKGLFQIIKNVVKTDRKETTYCLTELETGMCVFNNVLTKQCNYIEAVLQLSLYMYLAWENNKNLKIGKLFIRHIKLNDAGKKLSDTLIPVPYMKDEIKKILKYRLLNNES